jgi:AhpD family alkylhydroperoxidase
MNEVILSKNNLVMKRLWNLDTNTYEDGALDKRTKEMLGLVASMVLRCDDCVKYHVGKCHELGVNTDELYEIFAVANIVGEPSLYLIPGVLLSIGKNCWKMANDGFANGECYKSKIHFNSKYSPIHKGC